MSNNCYSEGMFDKAKGFLKETFGTKDQSSSKKNKRAVIPNSEVKRNIRISGLKISKKLAVNVINKSRDWRVTAIDITYVFNEDGYDEKMEFRLIVVPWAPDVWGGLDYQQEALFYSGNRELRNGITANYKEWWIDNVYGEKVKK